MGDNLLPPFDVIPNHWKLAKLSEITLKIGSGATPRGGSETYLPERSNFALIRSQNVFDRQFDLNGLAYISDEQASELRNVWLKQGDVLLNITGDGITFSRACIVPDYILPACVNQHVSIIRVDPNMCVPGYLLSYLTHPSVKHYIESFNAGGSRRAITKGHIESFIVPLPPLLEQRATAHILDSLDDKIELNRRMNATLEARALFQSWFVDFDPVHAKARGEQPSGMDAATAALFPDHFEDSPLGPIPAGWRVGTLNEITEFVLGGDWGKDEPDNEFTQQAFCIRGADIPDLQNAGLGKMPVRYLKQSSLEKRSLKAGDLVVEISGGSPTQSTGRPVYVRPELLLQSTYPITCSNFCRVVRLNNTMLRVYTYYWMRLLYTNDSLLQYETGTTGIKNFAFKSFSESHPMLIPSNEVLEIFQDIINGFQSSQQHNGIQSRTLAETRNALLPKLVSGEVRVTN